MSLALLMSLQAAAAPQAVDFDLARYKPSQPARCAASGVTEIVVCGMRPRGGDYPLEKMARIFEEKPLVAQTDLGGGAQGRAYVESVPLPNGMISKRAMVGIRLGF